MVSRCLYWIEAALVHHFARHTFSAMRSFALRLRGFLPAFAEPIYRADETDEADEPLPPKGKKAKHGKEDEAKDEAAERKEEKKRKKEDKKERARRAFRHFADEDEDFDISLRSLLGGDIFGSKRFRRQIGYFILLCVLAIIYISNRYAYQREEIRREKSARRKPVYRPFAR